MSGYTKLFQDIVTSTIWSENSDCRVLWITMLALKDRHNICRATVPYLAKAVGISLDETEKYLEKFQKPDKYSRSQEHEGRRIAPADGGWLILNGQKYQDALNGEHRKEQVRVAVAKHRAKEARKRGRRQGRPSSLPQPNPPRVTHEENCRCGVCQGIRIEGALDSPHNEREFQ